MEELRRQLDNLLPLICKYIQSQERRILQNGTPLDVDQQIDAYQIGIKSIQKVRLLEVHEIPLPRNSILVDALAQTGLISSQTIGITFRHGIYIRSGHWKDRRLVVHELTHTMQYERLGGIKPFIREYLKECLTLGYPNGALEREAIQMEEKICGR